MIKLKYLFLSLPDNFILKKYKISIIFDFCICQKAKVTVKNIKVTIKGRRTDLERLHEQLGVLVFFKRGPTALRLLYQVVPHHKVCTHQPVARTTNPRSPP
ncbi:unnamed protein product [Leptidea sinapis]|uniref:Uncharacterized protein n=1 Tax=Leptidea sinapis TaxID=189913 RepID=A0A5E4QX10_9NEOP|nr:unnamed protein product [Leptidea sinapis]